MAIDDVMVRYCSCWVSFNIDYAPLKAGLHGPVPSFGGTL